MTASVVDLDKDLAAGRAVLATEAAGLRALADSLDERFWARRRPAGRCERARGRLRHGQVRARRAQGRGHPRLHRHPGAVRPPGRGLARRPWHGRAGRCAAGAVEFGRDRRAGRPDRARPPLRAAAGRASPARAGSTLAAAADVALVLPAAREACPMGLAPTTSTTMQMALGDALAVALLTRRGFGPSDFRQIPSRAASSARGCGGCAS